VSALAIVSGDNTQTVPFAKAAWLITVLACLIAATLLLAFDYYGYGATLMVVAFSAAINLR